MLQAHGISMRYATKTLFENITIKLDRGKRYGLIGANGAGKSTFLKILSGEIEANSGEVILEPGLRPVSYTHLTLPTTCTPCRSRWSPYH